MSSILLLFDIVLAEGRVVTVWVRTLSCWVGSSNSQKSTATQGGARATAWSVVSSWASTVSCQLSSMWGSSTKCVVRVAPLPKLLMLSPGELVVLCLHVIFVLHIAVVNGALVSKSKKLMCIWVIRALSMSSLISVSMVRTIAWSTTVTSRSVHGREQSCYNARWGHDQFLLRKGNEVVFMTISTSQQFWLLLDINW